METVWGASSLLSGPGTEWPLHECGVNKWDSSQHVTLNTTKTSFGAQQHGKHTALTSWAQSVTVIKSTCVQSRSVAADIGNCLELCLLRLSPFWTRVKIIPSMGFSWWYSGQKSICQWGHGFKPRNPGRFHMPTHTAKAHMAWLLEPAHSGACAPATREASTAKSPCTRWRVALLYNLKKPQCSNEDKDSQK